MASLYRFTIATDAEPQALLRLLNHFAKRSLTPSRVVADSSRGELDVTIDQIGLAGEAAALIAEQMRGSVMVSHVGLTLCEANA